MTINQLNLVFFPNVEICAWNNMLASMQYQVRCMLSDFSYASNCQSHILDRISWLGRTTWLEKTICLIYGVRITSDYGSSLVTGPSLYFHSAMLVTTSWSCFMPLGHHRFHSKSLLWPQVLVPSHPGLQDRLPSVHVEHTH